MNRLKMSNYTRTLVSTAMLITMASILHIVEGMLPPIPAPVPVKLGLANIITVVTLVMFGPKKALTVAVGRTVLGSLFSFTITRFAMSFSGAIAAWLIMTVLYSIAKNSFSLVGFSLAGAVAHNLAQLFMANLIVDNIGIMALFPLLMFFAVPTGVLVGLMAGFLTRALGKVPQFQHLKTG